MGSSCLPFPDAQIGGFPSPSTLSDACLPVGDKGRRQGCGAVLGLAHPQSTCWCCCCHCFEAQKVIPSEDPYLPDPTACLGFPCFPSLSTRENQALCMSPSPGAGVGHLRKPWRRDSATRGSMSQPPPAGPSEMAAADGLCPICLGDLENATYVEVCQHRFCFVCIWEWAKVTETCPLCKQPFTRLLRTATEDSNHEECAAGWAGLPAAKGGQPGPRAEPHSSATTWVTGVLTPSPPWGEGGLWGQTEHRVIH